MKLCGNPQDQNLFQNEMIQWKSEDRIQNREYRIQSSYQLNCLEIVLESFPTSPLTLPLPGEEGVKGDTVKMNRELLRLY
jgi:hypothetical protein